MQKDESAYEINCVRGHWEAVDKQTKKVVVTEDTYPELVRELAKLIEQQ